MKAYMIEGLVSGLFMMTLILIVCLVVIIVADYVLVKIPFIQRYLATLPDQDDGEDEAERYEQYRQERARGAR